VDRVKDGGLWTGRCDFIPAFAGTSILDFLLTIVVEDFGRFLAAPVRVKVQSCRGKERRTSNIERPTSNVEPLRGDV